MEPGEFGYFAGFKDETLTHVAHRQVFNMALMIMNPRLRLREGESMRA